jgi:hypothetical protein
VFWMSRIGQSWLYTTSWFVLSKIFFNSGDERYGGEIVVVVWLWDGCSGGGAL